MSVLMGVLEEELDRLQRYRELALRDLQEEGISNKRREILQQVLLQIAEDLCRLHRALAPVDVSKVDELGFENQGGEYECDIEMDCGAMERSTAKTCIKDVAPMELYEKPQNRMRKARELAECYRTLERFMKDFTPLFDDDPKLNALMNQLSDEYDDLTENLDKELRSIIDDEKHFRVEIEFNAEKVAALGYTVPDVHKAVRHLFERYNLPCVVDGPILAITERGHKDDFSHLWIVIMELIRCDWFLSTVLSFYWFDGGHRENILVQALNNQRN